MTQQELMLIVSAGLIVIVLLILFVIPFRIKRVRKEMKENNRLLRNLSQIVQYTESQKGIKEGYIKGRDCIKCKRQIVPELAENGNCPFCGLSHKPGNIVYIMNKTLRSTPKDVYIKNQKRNKTRFKVVAEL